MARRRRFDPGPATAGLFFLAVAAVFWVRTVSPGAGPPLAVLAAGTLIGLGLVGVGYAASRGRRDL
ncbi:hypothetical protein [Thermomonospora catenispora]|uniref:hypothetical protein n=1 Tax=Thermomonospora catenispora TaxID=2493090 RepID=UPI001122598E|nr:hypothetical protein [Thermomonospora catenispora]TNY38733.1 hypothetical protein EIO00_00620 [Thermomonospora catenispora]